MSSWPERLTALTWTLFVGAAATLVAFRGETAFEIDGLLRMDGLAQIMAVLVTFVSGVVQSFARRYMAGTRHLDRFYGRLFVLTLDVLVLAMADNVLLFAATWTGMGLMLADLIGHVRNWPQAARSGKRAAFVFLNGGILVWVLLITLAFLTGEWTITGILGETDTLQPWVRAATALGLLGAAMVQSALVPFHRWLLSSMTAPTPVSAFMHAGIVNAGGLMLARFAPLYVDVPMMMSVVVVVGALSALAGQAWMLVQTDVKRQLACSTVAQMGFMVLQCGLGFFAAALTHLILHGFYKAYLFLASGSVVANGRPTDATKPEPSLLRDGVALGVGIAGGALFAQLTGKASGDSSAGLVLTFFVVISVLHATRSVLQRSALSASARLVALPALVLPALGVYALVYSGVTQALSTLPASTAPAELSVLHLAVAAVFFVAYLAINRGWHRRSLALYVRLVNTSQPFPETVLTKREEYRS